MEARRCIRCGRELRDDVLYCGYCGAKQDAETKVKDQEKETSPEKPVEKPAEAPAPDEEHPEEEEKRVGPEKEGPRAAGVKLPGSEKTFTKTQTYGMIAACAVFIVILIVALTGGVNKGPHHGFYALEGEPVHGFLIYTNAADGANEAVPRDSHGKIWTDRVYTWTCEDGVVTMKHGGITYYTLRYNKSTDTLYDTSVDRDGTPALTNGYIYKYSASMTDQLM